MSERLHRALKLAYRAHKRQDRDGEAALPYVTHVIDVVNRLRYVGLVTDEDILVSAFLHDALEETELSPERIEEVFGSRVLQIVRQVTREEPDPATRPNHSEESWYDLRNGLFLREIEQMGPEAWQIKLADRASNLVSARATRSPEKLARYVEQSKEILKRIPRAVNPPLYAAVEDLLE